MPKAKKLPLIKHKITYKITSRGEIELLATGQNAAFLRVAAMDLENLVRYACTHSLRELNAFIEKPKLKRNSKKNNCGLAKKAIERERV